MQHSAVADHVGEVLGAAGPLSTTERKIQAKQQRLAYGNQLQQQMAQQSEARKRERMERMGIPVPPSGSAGALQAPQISSLPPRPDAAAFASHQPPPPLMPAAFSQPGWHPGHVGPGQQMPVHITAMDSGVQQYSIMSHPAQQLQPAWAQSEALASASPGFQGGIVYTQQAHPPPSQPPAASAYAGMLPAAYSPASPRSYAAALAGPGPQNVHGAIPAAGSGLGPSSMLGGSPPAGQWYGGGAIDSQVNRQQMQPLGAAGFMMGGAAAQPAAFGSPAGGDKAAERARKDAYRLELEAQMRAKEERKRAEKEASLRDARQRQAAMAQRDYMGVMTHAGGGGGAPLRDPAGNIMSDLAAMRGFQQARDRGQAFGMMPQGPAPPPIGELSPMQNLTGAGFGAMAGFREGGEAMPSFSQMEQPLGLQHAGPHNGGPPDLNPNFRFRSDNAYLTKAELDNKARQKAELQEALERQIAEKKFKKEQEKAALQEEALREEHRLRMERERLTSQYQQDNARESGKDGGSAVDKVAAAWARAKAESDEAKKSKFEGRRAAGRKSQEGLDSLHNSMAGLPEQASSPAPATDFDAVHVQPVQQLVVAAPPTPLVAEKVKQMAAQELSKVRAEFQAEADSLRTVVEEQNAQVAALKQHAERMETRAEQAQAQVSQMRVDLIRSSMAAPESLMRMMADYPMQLQQPPPPNMLDIALDLPPPAAVQRRALQSQPVYDMGPLIPPVHNPTEADPQAALDFMATPGQQQRPPTQGLRSINPLEASLAAESVLIYPNGRELQRMRSQQQQHVQPQQEQPLMISAATHAASDLPFRSLALGPGAFSSMSAPHQLMQDSFAAQGQTLGGAQGGDLQGLESPGRAPLQHSSVMLSPGRAAAALAGVASEEAGQVPIRHMQGETLNPAPIPPGTADAVRKLQARLQEEAAAAAAAAAKAHTPMDVQSLMQQNKDKLELLQELNTLSATDSTEAIDAFLAKFSKARPGLPERTRTPLLRINTPTAHGYAGYMQSVANTTATSPSAATYIPSSGPIAATNSVADQALLPQRSLTRTSSQRQPPTAAAAASPGKFMEPIKPASAGLPPRSPIKFTDNNNMMQPAAVAGVSRPTSSASNGAAAEGSADVRQGLDPLADNQLPISRPASHGRRAGSASGNASSSNTGLQPRPPSAQQHTTMSIGDDTLDLEMRNGLGSRPPSGATQQLYQPQAGHAVSRAGSARSAVDAQTVGPSATTQALYRTSSGSGEYALMAGTRMDSSKGQQQGRVLSGNSLTRAFPVPLRPQNSAGRISPAAR